MQEQPTCGQGLAQNAVTPAHLAQVAATMAAVLEVHMSALNAADPEFEAYRQITDHHRRAATELEEAARLMADARDLPMGSHDMSVMTGPAVLDTFSDLVSAKAHLTALLHAQETEDQQLLGAMKDQHS